MRKHRLIIGMVAVCSALLIIVPVVMGAGGTSGDRTEANGCSSCHAGQGQYGEPGMTTMWTVVSMWSDSSHGNSYHEGMNNNTYCAKCMSPLQADPLATRATAQNVAIEDWQGITCSACHPDHAQRDEWAAAGVPPTRIGNYNIADGSWIPVYMDENPNDLCTYCHNGSHHEKRFQGFGQEMVDAGVGCVDCHMAEVPTQYEDGTTRGVNSHTWHVKANVASACIGCHQDHTIEWAEKQIDKGIIHGKAGYLKSNGE